MPAERLGAVATAIGRFDVMGLDANAPPGFVSHVGLVETAAQFAAGTPLDFVEMGPPLRRGPWTPETWGYVPPTVDEENRIGLFIDEQMDEHEAAKRRRDGGYIVRPHSEPQREADGTTVYVRYSCAGFVVEAYRAAEIDLVVTDEHDLPSVSLDMIERAYPMARNHERLRGLWGIPGNGPWHILMAGHLLHALARSAGEIRSEPYRPIEGDEVFPR
jgi:hypothetical protein